MLEIEADEVDAGEELDHDGGWISIRWNDDMKVQRALDIDRDGFCAREMPIHSGFGLVDCTLKVDHLELALTPALAQRLELEPQIKVRWRHLACGREYLEEFVGVVVTERDRSA